ncbi:MAG: ATP-binding response regulator [Anaerolineae bacterium]
MHHGTLLLLLPALWLAAMALIVTASRWPDPLPANGAAGALLVLGPLVWFWHESRYRTACYVLAVGLAGVAALLAASGGSVLLLFIVALVPALAAVLLGAAGGLLVGGLNALLILWLAQRTVPLDAAQLLGLEVTLWGAIGLVCLSNRPLLTAVQWSWAHHEESRRLLEQARDLQVRLKQTLADLADANEQLTRLNRLAQGLRQSAEEARRSKEQFVANVSHELRTPLNMIVGYSEMIMQRAEGRGAPLPKGIRSDLAVIHRNAQHLSSLVDDVLDLSQIEAGQSALTREPVDLHEIVQEAITAVQPLFASRGLELAAEVAEGLILSADRTRLREVILNLLSNAGRFTQEGGAAIRARREGDHVLVSVADTGAGIPADRLQRLFRPFEQLDPSIRRRFGGTGLGLAISKGFVELHGGEMWAESEVGRGTTFHFRLPLEAPAEPVRDISRWFHPEWRYEARVRPSLAPAPVLKQRLVVLEEGRALSRLLARYLNHAELVAAASMSQALSELARTPAQALLVNAHSLEAGLQQVRAGGGAPEGTPAIVCCLPDSAEAAASLDAAGYLVKPIAAEALLAALAGLPQPVHTVLIVDDEPEALKLFWRVLSASERGYRVITAGSGREALEVLRADKVDAVLLDLVMPEMDGFAFLAARREDPDLRSVPVIVISAQDPTGQPVVSSGLAVTRGGGLTARQLLDCVEGLANLLAPPGLAADSEHPAAPAG